MKNIWKYLKGTQNSHEINLVERKKHFFFESVEKFIKGTYKEIYRTL